VIDFVVTTKPPDGGGDYKRDFTNRKRIVFEDYRPNDLQSALVTKAQDRLDKIEKGLSEHRASVNTEISDLRNTFTNSLGIVLAAVGALVTALALFVGRVEPKFLTFLDPPCWFPSPPWSLHWGAGNISRKE